MGDYPRPFELERYFAQYEFSAPYMLCASDCESLPMSDLVSMMSESTRRLWDDLCLGYTDCRGHSALREAVAKTCESDKITAESVQIVTPSEGIYVALRSLLKAGDRVVCTWPGYQSLSEIALAQGAKVDHWEVEEGADGFFFDVDKLEELLAQPCQMVIVNFPHNPTGALPSHAEWERIVRIVQRSGAYLFSDEMYRGLEYDVGDRLSSACTVYPKAISLSGMSKAYGMPGLRIGWLVSQSHAMLASCSAYRDYVTICASAPAEVLALAGLENGASFLAKNRAIVLETIAALEDMLNLPEAAGHFRFRRPKAGPISLIALRSNADSSAYCEELVKKHGILLLPSAVFGWTNCYMRVGFGRRSGVEVVGIWKSAILEGTTP